MTEPPEAVPRRLQIASTPQAEIGHYADFVAVWHQNTSFVIDFLVFASPPRLGEDEVGNKVIDQDSRLSARVRIPPQQVFEILTTPPPEGGGFQPSRVGVPASQPAAAPTEAGKVLRHLHRHSTPKGPDSDRPPVPLGADVPALAGVVRFAHRLAQLRRRFALTANRLPLPRFAGNRIPLSPEGGSLLRRF